MYVINKSSEKGHCHGHGHGHGHGEPVIGLTHRAGRDKDPGTVRSWMLPGSKSLRKKLINNFIIIPYWKIYI